VFLWCGAAYSSFLHELRCYFLCNHLISHFIPRMPVSSTVAMPVLVWIQVRITSVPHCSSSSFFGTSTHLVEDRCLCVCSMWCSDLITLWLWFQRNMIACVYEYGWINLVTPGGTPVLCPASAVPPPPYPATPSLFILPPPLLGMAGVFQFTLPFLWNSYQKPLFQTRPKSFSLGRW
jgi:hypothetical protein